MIFGKNRAFLYPTKVLADTNKIKKSINQKKRSNNNKFCGLFADKLPKTTICEIFNRIKIYTRSLIYFKYDAHYYCRLS